jgi:hypothetical protein
MPSRISEKDLLDRVRQFIQNDPSTRDLDPLIKHALVMADRELRECDSLSPLAWDLVPWSGIRTVAPAEISDITQASPGVITAASNDSEVTGHGFPNHSTIGSVVYLDGIDGMEELNKRFFRLVYINSTTFSLKTLDGLTNVDTSGLTEYDAGGIVYHVGVVLNTTTILSGVSTSWGVKEIHLPSVTFDGYPTTPVSAQQAREEMSVEGMSRPCEVRYWKNYPPSGTAEHILFWYGASGDQYDVAFDYIKDVPDMSTWGDSTYPAHPAECHEFIWHGALAQLVGASERAKRTSQYEREFGSVEVLYAQKWALQWEQDKNKARNMNRRLMARTPWTGGLSA